MVRHFAPTLYYVHERLPELSAGTTLSCCPLSESDHGNTLTDFISWCDNFLDLNVSETKKLIIDFRCNRDAAKECNVSVEIVTS